MEVAFQNEGYIVTIVGVLPPISLRLSLMDTPKTLDKPKKLNKPKRLNVRFLASLLGVSAVFGITVHFVHGFQVKRNASSLLVQAEKAHEDKDAVKEIDYLARYLRLQKTDNEVRARYGLILDENSKKIGSMRGRMQAFFALETVLRNDPQGRDDLRRHLIDTAMEIGKFSDADAHLEILLKATPADAKLKRAEFEQLRARCKEALGQYSDPVKHEGADAFYKSALRDDPTQIDSYLRFALLNHDHLNNPSEANKTLDTMIEKNPKDYKAYLGRARYRLQREGQSANGVKLANADVERALALAPDEPDVLLAAVDVARAQGTPEKAMKLLSKGLESHPRDPRLYLALVAQEVRDEKPKEALNLVRKAVKELPDNSDLLHALADLLVQEGKLKEAEDTIKRLREMKYPTDLLDYLQARIHFHESKWSEAELILTKVHSKFGRVPNLEVQALLLLGQCHERLGNSDQALVAFQQARKLDPLSVPVRYRTGTTLMALGRMEEALSEFRNMLAAPKIPKGVHTLLARALIAVNRRLPRKARDLDEIGRELDLAAKEAPDAPDLTIMEAETLLLEDSTKVDVARKRIEKARDRRPDEVSLWIASAQLASGRKEALAILDRAKEQPKLAEKVELRLARLSYSTLASLQASSQDTKVSQEDRAKQLKIAVEKELATLAEMEKDAEKLRQEDRSRLLNGLADAYLNLGSTDDAARLWRKVAEQQPTNLGVLLALFDLALISKDGADQERILKKIHDIEGENGTFWRYGEAASRIQQARPANKEKLSEIARSKLLEARKSLMEAARRRPSWARIPALEGEIDELEGSFSAAVDKYQHALDLGERRPAIVRRAVQLLFEQQRFAEANAAVRKLLDQENLLLSAGLGKLAVEALLSNPANPDSEHALDLARKSVSPESKSYLDHLWMGRTLAGMGKQKEAEESLRRAWQLSKTTPETWVALVGFLAGSGKKEKREEAEQAIKQASKHLQGESLAITLAACYENLGDLAKAEEQFLTALKGDPQNARMLRNVANFYIRHGQSAKAEPHLRALLALEGNTSTADIAADIPWARRALAVALASNSDQRRFAEALALVEKNLAENKNSTADEHARARLLATRGSRRKEAIRLFEAMPSLAADERFTLASLYFADDNWDKAYLQMTTLLASAEGKNPTYLAYFARRLLQHDDIGRAQEQLDKLEKALPDSFLTREIKARVLQAKGKDSEAVAVIHEYVQGKNADLTGAAFLLESLGHKKDAKSIYREEAEAIYRKFSAQSDKPERFLPLAGFLGRKHSVAEALSCCEEALRLKAAPEAVAPVMAAVLRDTPTKEQVSRVEKSLQGMLTHAPDSIPLLICLADLYDMRERFEEAEKLYRHVLGKDEENLVALNNLAWLLAFKSSSEREEALAMINKAIALVGPSPELLDTRGVVYLMLARSEKAIADLQQALVTAPSATRSFHLARAQAAANKIPDAGKTLEEARKRGFDVNRLHPLEKPLGQQLLSSLR